MGILGGHFVYILVCVSFVSNEIEKGTIMALSGVRESGTNKGFQRLRYNVQPLEGKKKSSPIIFRRNGGKEETNTVHAVGLTLSTVFDHVRFIHSVTVTDPRLVDSFRKADIPTAGCAQMTSLYDLDVGSLDHEDILQYVERLYNNSGGRDSTFGNELQLSLLYPLEQNVYHSPSITVNISISPLSGFRLLCKVVTINTRKVIVTEKLDNGRMYRDKKCVIASVVNVNDYITALPDGRLGLRPLLNGGGSARGAVFIVRQYMGFTSEVHDPYRVFQDGSAVHVHMFQMPERSQKMHCNDSFIEGAVGYISRGFFQAGADNNTKSKRGGFQGEEEEDVFINTRSRVINSYVLREEDPRFFYEMKISGTDLSVFMSTSKPNHYLAVHGNKATLSLQQVPNAKDFLRGYDEAKFRVFEIGKQFNLTLAVGQL